MTFKRLVCIVLLATLSAVLVHPGRAEALEPMVISILIGVGIALVALIVVLIAANASEGRRRSAELSVTAGSPPVLVIYVTAPEAP